VTISDPNPRVNDALKLYTFFESKGFQDKQQMMTLVTWLAPVVFALIAYCWSQFAAAVISSPSRQFASGLMPLAAGIAAVLVSRYAKYVIREFAVHAEQNYRKADQSRAFLPQDQFAELLKFPQQTRARTWLDQQIQNERKRLGPDGASADHIGSVFLVLSLGARCVFWLSVLTAIVCGAWVILSFGGRT
jgi:hypothetical protein